MKTAWMARKAHWQAKARGSKESAEERCVRNVKKWCGWRGSNPRPLASEANTLSTELQPRLIHC